MLSQFIPVAAVAQDQPAESEATDKSVIIVTAQRRQEAQVDVPITVTSIAADAILTANVVELTDIIKLTPGLRFDRQTQFVQPTIRGIGTSVTNSGGGSNVGIYIDGFYSPNPIAADFQFLNVDSIQVLKGPQGTLFGRNTTGGAILVQTADPSETAEGRLRASYGRFNEIDLQTYLTGPIAEGVAVALEGRFRQGDGFQTDIITGNDRIGAYESWSVRAGVKFELSPDVSILLRYQRSETDDPRALLTNAFPNPVPGVANGAPFFAPAGTFTTNPNLVAVDRAPFFTAKTDILQATIRADLGFGELSSYTQYRTEDTDSRLNLDHSALPIFAFGLPVDNSTFSQELLLTSKASSTLQWTAGLFYFQNRDTYETFIDNTGRVRLGGSGTLTRSYAAFADLTYEITPQLFITAGGRLAHDEIDDAYYITPFSGVRTFVTAAQADAVSRNTFTPRIVLRYKPDDDSSVYASYSKGYKAGILDVGGSTGNPVSPEDVDAFEVGYKFDNRTFGIELAGFYYDYSDLQVSLFTGSPPSAQILNAASSEIYGLEGQVRWNPGEGFRVNAGATWVHARYREFRDAPVYSGCTTLGAAVQANCLANGVSFIILPGQTLRNVTMQRTPEFTGNIGASYEFDLAGGELNLSGNLYYSSSFFFGPSGIQFESPAFENLSLRAQWNAPQDGWYVAVFGDNITGARYPVQAQFNNFGIGATWNDPVTWGLEVGMNF
jgi:iron complex outermembrane receptor protein